VTEGVTEWAVAAPALRDGGVPLTVEELARFLKNPVREHFRLRLDVVFRDGDDDDDDEEVFALDGLEQYGLLDDALREARAELQRRPAPWPAAELRLLVEAQAARLRRAGRLPMAALGERAERELGEVLLAMLAPWGELQARYPQACAAGPLCFEHAGVVFADALTGLRVAPDEPGAPVWLELLPGRLCADTRRGTVRPEALIAAWLRTLAASAVGLPVQGVLVGRDATVTVGPLPDREAQATLALLLQAWREGMAAPLPLACRTALALAGGASDVATVYDGGPYQRGEVEDTCLARVFPDFEALSADGRFVGLARQLYGPLLEWARDGVTLELHPQAGAAEEPR
jgi:exodeoxyribonuclease V gamma subunit